jgi:hypothetical protein
MAPSFQSLMVPMTPTRIWQSSLLQALLRLLTVLLRSQESLWGDIQMDHLRLLILRRQSLQAPWLTRLVQPAHMLQGSCRFVGLWRLKTLFRTKTCANFIVLVATPTLAKPFLIPHCWTVMVCSCGMQPIAEGRLQALHARKVVIYMDRMFLRSLHGTTLTTVSVSRPIPTISYARGATGIGTVN